MQSEGKTPKFDRTGFPVVANFKSSEFACKCGCGKEYMRADFILTLQAARTVSDCSYIISSGYRCKQHNANEGAKPTSSHPKGCAADIKAKRLHTRFRILNGLIHAGFGRIGIGKDFIHVDDDGDKRGEIIWLYSKEHGRKS